MEAKKQSAPRILVVDDSAEIRQMVVTHLKQMKCEVLEAPDGETGLSMFLTETPDLVLLDVMMPGLNGWEIAKYIREKSEFDHIGVIMVTAIGESVNEMTAPLYGADEHINKPFQLSELDFKIRKILSQKRQLAPEQTASPTPPLETSPSE